MPKTVRDMLRGFLGALEITLASILLALATTPVWGQLSPSQRESRDIQQDMRLESTERRLSAIDTLSLDRRLALIEQTLQRLETGATANLFTMGGVAAMLAQVGWKHLMNKKDKSD